MVKYRVCHMIGKNTNYHQLQETVSIVHLACSTKAIEHPIIDVQIRHHPIFCKILYYTKCRLIFFFYRHVLALLFPLVLKVIWGSSLNNTYLAPYSFVAKDGLMSRQFIFWQMPLTSVGNHIRFNVVSHHQFNKI